MRQELDPLVRRKAAVLSNRAGEEGLFESLVEHNVTGQLVRPGATVEFADALQAYCGDADLRARHGQAGLKRSEKYSWDRINRGLAETYIRLIRQRQSGSGGVPYRAIR